MNETSPSARAWRSLARRVVRKINAGWWLERFSPLLIVTGIGLAAAILILRSRALPIANNLALGMAAIGALLAVALVAWWMARRNFLDEKAGLVRLEERLHLKNALTTADRGIGKWPDSPADDAALDDGLVWNWPRVLAPIGIAAMAVVAAIFIPISTVSAPKPPPSEPLAWAQMEEWMELLEEENLIEEEGLREVEEKIEQLRRQPEQDWFSHSSLEATDTLKQSLQQQIQKAGAEMATAERDLNALQNYGSQLSEETRDQLMEEYDQAIQDLALSGLPLNPDLLDSLKQLDLSQLSEAEMNEVMKSALSQLSQEEQQKLAEAIKDGNLAEALQNGQLGDLKLTPEMMKALQQMTPGQLQQMQLAQMTQEQIDALRQALKRGAEAFGKTQGDGDALAELELGDAAFLALLQQQRRGKPGINRGPGPAPLFLSDNETDIGTNHIEGVSNLDPRRASPGAVLGVGISEYDLDKKPAGVQQGGQVNSMGQGGDTVWKEALMPSEKAVLKRYFK
ncbi:MAG: hypothetical protein KDN19_09580 [Verrucomicrobiae bacterium]|nr:hypothetical protein [Verrucomicrobiae bacterium]